MNTDNANAQPSALTPQELEALNKHGVFFKKRVLQILAAIQGVSIVDEELGVSFGDVRVSDIVALDRRQQPHLYFIFECKRAYATDRKWIFFRDFHGSFRMLRSQHGTAGHSSVISPLISNAPIVCSEGYEFKKNESKADQNPIFIAAAQLSAGYLGFIARRERDLHPRIGPPAMVEERYVPVLVTNAEIVVIQRDLSATKLDTGNLANAPDAISVNSLILKQPFPTPDGLSRDFRDEHQPPLVRENWSHFHKESIFVVRAPALQHFITSEYRDLLGVVEKL